jgi:hypothetical protein
MRGVIEIGYDNGFLEEGLVMSWEEWGGLWEGVERGEMEREFYSWMEEDKVK